MSTENNLIVETADRIFSDLMTREVNDRAEEGVWPSDLWDAMEKTGLLLAGVSEDSGGAGGDRKDSLDVIRRSAYYAAPLPLAESLLAAWLMEESGAEVLSGPVALASGNFSFDSGLSGTADDVIYMPHCQHLLCVGENLVGIVASEHVNMSPVSVLNGKNMAGESLTNISVNAAEDQVRILPFEGANDRLMVLGALVRSCQLAGALESVLEIAVNYVQERQQFGRPLARFQAIQHQLAVVAGEVAAAGQAAETASRSLLMRDIAIAKSRTGEASGRVAEHVHQVLGAIGYTREHDLNHRTRRLWCWREDYGNETYWNNYLGEIVYQKGSDNLWPFITA